MASVKIETRNEGRGLHEWDYLPLSEKKVVEKLIQNRWKFDPANYLGMEGAATLIGLMDCGGVSDISEPIRCTYISLDELIERAELTKSQRKVIRLLMEGYSILDIAEKYNVPQMSVVVHFKRAVDNLVAENNRSWEKTYGAQKNET